VKPVIQFEHVYKQYRLGLGRTSLREAVASNAKKIARRNAQAETAKQSLWALHDVSFELHKGGALGLIGPNGAGKTTILKILAKITRPTSGIVDIQGRVSALIELGAGFHPDLSGRENIYLNGAILGLSRKEISRVFDRIVDFSGLERFIDTPVKRYSSGMYVRLGFSVAAHIEPDVLLVDEVLAVGDAQFRQKCARRIEDLRNSGTTIVFVAHNLYLVKSVCDTAIFMNKGRVQVQGDVVDAITAYEAWLHENQITLAGEKRDSRDPTHTSVTDLTAIEIRRLDGTVTDKFTHQDAVEIRVHYKARQPVQQPNLVLRITRADGVTSCMIRTIDYGYTLKDMEGDGIISVAIDPLQLAGGAYVIEAKLMTNVIDGIPLAKMHSSWFEVEGLSLGHVEASGVFVPQVIWARIEEP